MTDDQLPKAPAGCGFLVLTPEEAEVAIGQGREPNDYLVVRLPPVNNPMQMQVLPDGSHALLQPFHMPKGTMAWQLPTSIVDLNGQPIAQLKPGDIIAVEMRLVVRREALAAPEAVELPPLPTLTPLEA